MSPIVGTVSRLGEGRSQTGEGCRAHAGRGVWRRIPAGAARGARRCWNVAVAGRSDLGTLIVPTAAAAASPSGLTASLPTTTTTSAVTTTTTTTAPAPHDSGARPPDHHDAAPARRQPAEPRRADAPHRRTERKRRAVPVQLRALFAEAVAGRAQLPDVAGRSVPLRRQQPRRPAPRCQCRLQARAVHRLSGSGQAVGPQRRGRGEDAEPRLQRRPARDRMAGPRTRFRRPEPTQDLHAGNAGGSPRVRPRRGRGLPEARGGDGEAAQPLRHLHAARHAPGRLQHEFPRRGGARLGRVHRRRPHRADGWAVVEQLLEPAARYGGPPLLDQRRRGQPPGPVRPRLGHGGELFQERPLGGRVRPLQRALLHRDPDGGGVHFHRQPGVLLHGDRPHAGSWPTGPRRSSARPTCRATVSSRRSRPWTTAT